MTLTILDGNVFIIVLTEIPLQEVSRARNVMTQGNVIVPAINDHHGIYVLISFTCIWFVRCSWPPLLATCESTNRCGLRQFFFLLKIFHGVRSRRRCNLVAVLERHKRLRLLRYRHSKSWAQCRDVICTWMRASYPFSGRMRGPASCRMRTLSAISTIAFCPFRRI